MALESIKTTDLSRVTLLNNNSDQNSGSNNGNKLELANTTKELTPKMQGDATSINANKGGIPSGGLFSSNKPEFVTKAELTINKFSNNKKELESIMSALDNFDPSKGIDAISDDDINSLLNLGFDVVQENGQVVIKDDKGNIVDPNDFMKFKNDLTNTIKRTIGGTSTPTKSNIVKPVSEDGSSKIKNEPVVAPKIQKMTAEQEEAMLGVAQQSANTDTFVNTISKDTKAELEKNIKAYDDMVNKSKQQTQKVDMSISNILSLKDQAQNLIEKGKKQPLNDIEKKQLNSIVETMQIKQKELQNNQASSEVLMNQVNQAFSVIAPSLSPSQKDTANVMQSALQAKVSNQAISARQDFVLAISEEASKLTSMMSPDEKQKFMSDPNMRMKALSPFNKMIDKMSTAKSSSDFNADEVKFLKDKLKIDVVNENGKVAFYHVSNDGKREKVSNNDFKDFRTDLNNIVTSPELFTLATAVGQVSLAYEKGDIKSSNTSEKNVDTKKEIKVNSNPIDLSSASENKAQSNNFKDPEEIKQREIKSIERNSIDGSIEKKREEEKYHNKQLGNIHERTREMKKYVDNKNVALAEENKRLVGAEEKRLDAIKDQEIAIRTRTIKVKEEAKGN
ncbi:MAG: hypothetical protein AABZ74_09360 [Cyanobacteriota bacterium]|mgnify:CR=1 FL=1